MAQDDSEHPALKGFNSTIETVKETGWGAVKGAVIGAVILGGAALLAPGLIGGLIGGGVGLVAGGGILSFITAPLGMLIGGLGGTAAAGALGGTSLAAGAAIMGAKLGGLFGAGRGLLNAGEEVEKKKQQLIDNYERNEMRVERREAMGMRQEMSRMNLARQAQAMGISPDSLPRGMSTGRQMGA